MGGRGERATAGSPLWTLRKLRGLFLAPAKLGPPEEVAEPEAAVVPGHGFGFRAQAPMIEGERVQIVLDSDRQSLLDHLVGGRQRRLWHAADFKFKAPFEYNASADSLDAKCQSQQIASQVARIDDSANFVTCRR
jgi:hypothetical protein